MEWANSLYNTAKNKVDGLTGSDIEKLVKEATSNENWGVSGTVKAEIAHYTYDFQGCKEVMGIVWKRLGETGRNWRMVFKSLQLLDYLIKNGHERVANMALERRFQVKSLNAFAHFDEDQRDRGAGVRELSGLICDLLNDWNQLREIRQEQRKHRKKFKGIANTGFGSSEGNFGGGHDDSTKWKDDWEKREPSATNWGDEDTSSSKKKKKKKKKKKNKQEEEEEEEEEVEIEELAFDSPEEEEVTTKSSKKKNKKKRDKNKKKKKNQKQKEEVVEDEFGGDWGNFEAPASATKKPEAPAQDDFDMGFNFGPAPGSQKATATVTTQNNNEWDFTAPTTNTSTGTSNDWDAFSPPTTTTAPVQTQPTNDFLNAFAPPVSNNNNNNQWGMPTTTMNNNTMATNNNNQQGGSANLFDMLPTSNINNVNTSMNNMNMNNNNFQPPQPQQPTINTQSNQFLFNNPSPTMNNAPPTDQFGDFDGNANPKLTQNSVKADNVSSSKKSDAWTMNSNLVNLDDITKESNPNYAAFDPNSKKKKYSAMPSLSTYGQNKPDPSAFNMGGMAQMRPAPMMNRPPQMPQQQFGGGFQNNNFPSNNMNNMSGAPQGQRNMNQGMNTGRQAQMWNNSTQNFTKPDPFSNLGTFC